MSGYTRSGRPRPQGDGWEVAVWYLMRLTGLALFVLALAHYLILHFLFDPAEQTAAWIIDERWNQLFWRAFDWTLLKDIDPGVPYMLSGGLDAHNVSEALRITHAPGVDVSSGVERAPGEKDPDKIRAFVRAARAAEPVKNSKVASGV